MHEYLKIYLTFEDCEHSYFQSKRTWSWMNMFHLTAIFCRISDILVSFIRLLLIVLSIFFWDGYSYFTESHNDWDRKRPLNVILSSPHAWAGLPIAGCPGPCLDGFWIFPMMKSLQPVFPVFSNLHNEKAFLKVQMESPVFRFMPIASIHFETYA